MIRREGSIALPTLHQSAVYNRLEIGCILSKDYNLSSAVRACNSCHILPGVKQTDFSYKSETSISVRPQQHKEILCWQSIMNDISLDENGTAFIKKMC